MDTLPNNPLFRYNPDTLIMVRKKHNLEKSEDMNKVIDILEDWIKQQNHFKKTDYTRAYLENTIIVNKGSIERAKAQISRLCALKSLLPTFFDGYKSRSDLLETKKYLLQAWLPRMTEENHRVYVVRVSNGATTKCILNVYKFGILLNEYLRAHDYNDGVIVFIDFRNVNVMEFASNLNLADLRNIMTIAMEGYDVRVKGIHFFTSSKTIDVIVNIMKQVVSAKLGSRIHTHLTLDSLYKYITPNDILPAEYGGNEESLDDLSDKLINTFTNEDNVKFFAEMAEAGVHEALRPKDGVACFDEQSLGIAGSFRTLSVD
ncbi:alpha-tocopherol transfer protein-like [Bombyx mori]|uniref:CRAL-TRIO domain-containing protein n=1 Tax=Bombyx mori TaxID=7091 RepID=A0A8R2M1J5_BOMMO|nr:alpha-tocopherol transfer protein-like [Bombyx mori]